MFPANRKCHFRLASLFHSLSLSVASFWPEARRPHLLLYLSLHSGRPQSVTSPLTSVHQALLIFYRSCIWPPAFIEVFLHLPVVISISQNFTYATSGPSFVSSPLWFFSPSEILSNLPPIPSHTYICISSFLSSSPWLIPYPSPHTFSVPCLGSSWWWDSYSLPDEALANGCWIMHGGQDLESLVY